MANVKLTKNELKRQKDMLARFNRYLPTLQLKKQQLQMVIRQVEAEIKARREEREEIANDIHRWVELFGEDLTLEELVVIEKVETDEGNIAGIDIPVFQSVTFQDIRWDLYAYPLWTDTAVDRLKKLVTLDAEIAILEEQRWLIAEELRITTQRVNLFEKVMIPETKENIRQIQIYLGDQQTAAVVRGKMAKNNIVKREATG
jgi:V/A-type H+-transporting ATPase subunit D